MMSRTAEHGLRAVLYLAARGEASPVPAATIAAALALPANYLGKTLNRLAKAGVLESVRGPSGGFRLSVPAGELSLAAVVEAFDRLDPGGRCMVGEGQCDATNPCGVHGRWTAVTNRVAAVFRGTTVGDLIGTG